MKKSLIILLVLAAFLPACVHNEGDIGDIFGLWRFEYIDIDGNPADFDISLYSCRFQKNIIAINFMPGDHSYITSYGTWQQNGNELLLNFTHTNATSSDGGEPFNPPPLLGIPGRQISTLDIVMLEGSNMVLKYRNPDGVLYIYRLKKVN